MGRAAHSNWAICGGPGERLQRSDAASQRIHRKGGAANLRLCVDALNQNRVELGKGKQGPKTSRQGAIFSEEYNVNASFVQVCRSAFSRGRAELATANAGIERASFLPRMAAPFQLGSPFHPPRLRVPSHRAASRSSAHLNLPNTERVPLLISLRNHLLKRPSPERDGIKSPG